MQVEQTLAKYFGYHSFRPGQKEVIEAVLRRKRCDCLIANGYGEITLLPATGLYFFKACA